MLCFAIIGVLLSGCGGAGSSGGAGASDDTEVSEGSEDAGGTASPQEGAAQQESAIQAPAGESTIMDIRIISKSFNNQFYEEVFHGARIAAGDMGVTLTTEAPDVENEIEEQVRIVGEAVSAKPAAIILAACDTASLEEPLTAAKNAGIPVIGFDSGVPGDSTGAVLATAATDNIKAGANAAKHMTADEGFREAILKGTEQNPAVLAVLAQDATSGSICDRVDGFIAEAVKHLEALDGLAGAVDVSGYEKWVQPSAKPPKVKIVVDVPDTSGNEDILSVVNDTLDIDGLVGIFAANQGAVNGLLSATKGGYDLDKTEGKYKDIFAVGFDSGEAQQKAVAAGQFLGSVTQDPYQMGYQAVVLAIKAAQNQSVADVDTGSRWYNAENIESKDIAPLMYD